jgi:hypothetical protein
MADNSRSKRHRPKLEPISIEELEADSTMTGLTSIFRIPTTEPPLPHMRVADRAASTVDVGPESTVDAEKEDAANYKILNIGSARRQAVETIPASTVDVESRSTVDVGPASTVSTGVSFHWQIEEDGRFFPATRGRRIERAQDALSRPEEAVYDFLWQPALTTRDSSRLISMGYDRIATATKISKRNVRHIIQRLIAKGFIAIEGEADSGQRKGTVYRVFSYNAVREEQLRRGRNWVVRTGNGVFYAKRIAMPLGKGGYFSTAVDSGPTSTVDAGSVDAGPASTVDVDPASVDAASTVPLFGSVLSTNKTTSSSLCAPVELISALRDAGFEPDDEILLRLVAACSEAAARTTGAPATTDEILYFTGLKLRAIRNSPNVRSPLALLAAVVPKCFEGESFRQFRQERGEREAREQQIRDAQQREIEAALEYNRRILADPDAPEDEKRLARMCLGLD